MLDVEPNKVKKISHVITQFPAVHSLGREKQDVLFSKRSLVSASFILVSLFHERKGRKLRCIGITNYEQKKKVAENVSTVYL